MSNPWVHPAIAEDGQLEALKEVTGGYFISVDHRLQGPNVVHSFIPEANTQEFIHPRNAILHSNAGPKATFWSSLWRWWGRADVTGEPHFQVGLNEIVEIMPLNRRADCNAKANAWTRNGRRVGAVSFETEDQGSATLATTPWSLEQVNMMVAALTCISVCYGVWCTTPTSWDDSGIGYHSQYKEWSIYVGKTCPGAARIRQMDWIRQAVANNLARYAQLTGWTCGRGGV